MIGLHTQVCKQELFTAGFPAAALRLHGDKNGINLIKGLRIIELENPALVGCGVNVENAQVHGLGYIWPTPPPRLKGASLAESWLLVQVVGIENQRFSLRVEDSSKWLLRFSIAPYVEHLRDVKI